MQTFTRDTILQGVDLTYIGTDKFKTGYLSACLTAPLSKKTAAYNAVLPSVLRRGTSTYPDMESIAAALDEMYGAEIEPVVRKRGEAQIFGFVSSFADDRFLPGYERIFEHVSTLMAEMLIHPNTFHGRLNEEYVKSEKQNLIDEIRSELNNKQTYAVNRMLENMYKDEPYSVNRLGSESEARKISVATLTKHYHRVLSSSKIEIFYCGSLEYSRVKDALISAFSSLPRGEIEPEIVTEVTDIPNDREIKVIKETMPNITQGKFAMGVRLGRNYRQLSIAALYVFDAVYGGCLTSKLFTNVRERLSLCYYASSSVDIFKGVMYVRSGIDREKYDIASKEILSQLENMKNGDITDDEIENAKKKLITDLKRVTDYQQASERYFIDRFAAGIFFTPDEMIELIGRVTKDDLVKVAESVKPDTIYFLYGEEEADDEQ